MVDETALGQTSDIVTDEAPELLPEVSVEAPVIRPRISGGFEPPAPKPAPSAGDVLGAAFTRENEIGSAIDYLSREHGFEREAGYNPFDDAAMKGRYLDEYGDRFVGVRSSKEANAIRDQIEKELERARIIESAGAWGMAAGMAAGIMSPTTLLPGGAVVRSSRLGTRIGGTAGTVAAAAAAGTAAQELVLQGTQETRTAGESLFAVGGSAFLGGLLGGAVGALNPAKALQIEADLTGKNPNPETHLLTPGVGRQSVGAAAVADVDTRLVNRFGSRALAKVTAFMTPLSRGQTSDAAATRMSTAQIADPGGIRMEANTEDGGFTPVVPGGSVGTRVRTFVDAIMARYQQDMDAIYQDYWKSVGGTDGMTGRVAIGINAARRLVVGGDGPLSPTEFFEMVGRTRGLDPSEITDPLIRRAVDTQMRLQTEVLNYLPDEIRPEISGGPKFAGWYLARVFNPKAIAAKAAEFEETIFRNMRADQERKALLQQDADRLAGEMDETQKAIERIERQRETLEGKGREVGARVGEMRTVSKRGQSRYEAAQARVFDMNSEITYLETELAVAKEQKSLTAAELKALEKELSVLRRARDKALRDAEKEPKDVPADDSPKSLNMGTLNPVRMVKFVTGDLKEPKVPKSLGFIQWIISAGGVKDAGGDVRSYFGGKPPKGLIRQDGMTMDELAQSYAVARDEDPYIVGSPGYKYEDEIDGFLADAAAGKDPDGWADAVYPDLLKQRIEEYEFAQNIRDRMLEEGLDYTDRKQVVAFLRGDDPDLVQAGRPGNVVNRADPPEMDDDYLAALLGDPIENFRTADSRTAAKAGDLKAVEKDIKTLRSKIMAREKVEARQTGRNDEAAVNARASRSRLDILLDRAERIAQADDKIAKQLDDLSKQQIATREKLEKIVSDWEGDTTKAARRALERRAKMESERQQQIAAGTYGQITSGRRAGQMSSKAPGRLAVADGDVDTAIRQIIKSERGKTDAELRTQARDIVQNMMASPDGRLPYEWGETAAKQTRAGNAFAGDGVDIPFLKERRFPVPDGDMLDVLDNDVRRVFHAYVHSMIPQAEMHRMFGDVRGTSAIRAIQEEYGAKIAEAKTEKERMALREQMNRDIKDFDAMRDRELGVYGLPSDPDSLFYRGATVARQANFLSKMGMMVVSSIADTGATIMRHGLGRTFDALGDALNRFSKDPQLAKIGEMERRVLQDAGVAVEMLTGARALSFAEIATDYGRASKFERGMQQATGAFSFINLSRQWDTAVQTIAGLASMRRMMRNIEDWTTKGKIDPGEAEWMASLNIGENQARQIWKAAQAGDGERFKGVLIPEGRSWKDREAYDMFRVALKQTVESTIVKPGQDKPLWMSTPTGKVIGQFRSFIIAAHQRLLLAGLQQADVNMGVGAATMVGLGTLSVALSDLARNGQLKERDPGEWFVEGFDRSGLSGWLMEVNNVAEKISGQQFGLRPMAGQEPATRSLNQSKADAVLGPTLGFISDATRIAGAPLRGELTRGDTRAIRNQLPGQNLFWFRHVFNAAHDSVDKALGIYQPPRPN